MSYIGNAPVAGAFKKLDNIKSSFNGVATVFPLTVGGLATVPATAQNLIISVADKILEPGVGYTISGSTITLAVAPAAVNSFFGVQLGSVGEVNTVGDGTITGPKLAGGAVDLNSSTVVGLLPINKGGTGSTTSTSALVSLGAEPAINILPINKGGTGATSAELARQSIGAAASTKIVSNIISTNTTAISGTYYVAVAQLTLTLPLTPSSGDFVGFSNFSGLLSCVIARNGQLINMLAENLTVDIVNTAFTLQYANQTVGWVFV